MTERARVEESGRSKPPTRNEEANEGRGGEGKEWLIDESKSTWKPVQLGSAARGGTWRGVVRGRAVYTGCNPLGTRCSAKPYSFSSVRYPTLATSTFTLPTVLTASAPCRS